MSEPAKILIIRLSSIGDILLSTPLIRVLRKRFPSSRIDYLTGVDFQELIQFNSNIDRVFIFDRSTGFRGLRDLRRKLLPERYDLVIDIHDSLRSKYLRSQIGAKRFVTINKRILKRIILIKLKWNLYKNIVSVEDKYIETIRAFGGKNDGEGLEIYIGENAKSKIDQLLREANFNLNRPVLGLSPSAKHFTKRWLPERFVKVAMQFVTEQKGKVVIFGGPEDHTLCNDIVSDISEKLGKSVVFDFSGKLSLLETAAAIDYCDLVLTNDTGLMHLARARKKRIVALFGPTVKEFGFFPQEENSVVIETLGLSCRPCSHIGSPKCPKGHFRCMKDIDAHLVYRKMRSLLSKG